MEEIKTKLDQLADLQTGQEAIRLRKQEDVDKVFTPVIKARLAEIDTKYQEEAAALQSQINVLDLDIRTMVLKCGESVKGSRLHAVWAKGRESWDTKALNGYAAGHPEIAQFKHVGEPSVAIRPVKA